MKRKVLKAVLAGIAVVGLFIAGCGNGGIDSINVNASSIWNMEYVKGVSWFEVYRDNETGVNYIIYKRNVGQAGWGGMCPRYNADGSLYVD